MLRVACLLLRLLARTGQLVRAKMATPLEVYLASQVDRAVRDLSTVAEGQNSELRLVFLGPPLEILEGLFGQLKEIGTTESVPVLLQVPRSDLPQEGNPPIGASGRCDHSHLLTIRDTPSCPRFLALVPPGQHMDRSISTTVEEFGVSHRASAGLASFEQWWTDSFVIGIVEHAIDALGLSTERVNARSIVEYGARCADEMDDQRGSRLGPWRLLERLLSVRDVSGNFTPAERLCLACGVPPTESGTLDPKNQRKALECIASAFEEGFRAGIDRASQNADSEEERVALIAFREFIESCCDLPTMFERAAAGYYAPSKSRSVGPPPAWWKLLDASRWIDLLEESNETPVSLSLEVRNNLNPKVIGGLFVVQGSAELRIAADQVADSSGPIEVLLERRCGKGAAGKTTSSFMLDGEPILAEIDLPQHSTPARFVAYQNERQEAAIKVISLDSWEPGIHVHCRTAKKVSPLRKVQKKVKGGPRYEGALVLEGAGRHMLEIFMGSAVTLPHEAQVLLDEASRSSGASVLKYAIREASEYLRNVEIEIPSDADLILEVNSPLGGDEQSFLVRIHLTIADSTTVGCSGEFEKLVLENRSSVKRVVSINALARLAAFEAWILEDSVVASSWHPVVIGEDYADTWKQPSWSGSGPCFSSGRFINDPRPAPEELVAPPQYLSCRRRLFARIRGEDNAGLSAQATFGRWMQTDQSFRADVEGYVDAFLSWYKATPEVACWADIVAVTSFEGDRKTVIGPIDAILVSPLHPLRLAWQSIAQAELLATIESAAPCPAAVLLNPDVVPDLLTLFARSPDGIEEIRFLSVECSSDYWSVLWNSAALGRMRERARKAPFGAEFGVSVGGLTRGISASQVEKSLDDVANLLPAKPTLSVGLAPGTSSVDYCNEGVAEWCRSRFMDAGSRASPVWSTGRSHLDVLDYRESAAQPDEATVVNLIDDTGGAVRWFTAPAEGRPRDLSIIPQVDVAQPSVVECPERSSVSQAALVRHRVRRQLPLANQAFLVESRMAAQPPASSDSLYSKVGMLVYLIENTGSTRLGYRFAPDVAAIRRALSDEQADYVAVSSDAIDPACFAGDWLEGAYLWDYSLPPYSQRAGDSSGSYLIARIKDVDRESLRSLVATLPSCDRLNDKDLDGLLREVAKRGIPTVRELSGEDSRACGALGMFVASRVLQDCFREGGSLQGLLPSVSVTDGVPTVTLVVPVDPFQLHIEELTRAVGSSKDLNGKRPDLLAISFRLGAPTVTIRLTPIEVKARTTSSMTRDECLSALGQAKALSRALTAIQENSHSTYLWSIAFHQLVLSMACFGIRTYSQNKSIATDARAWAAHHQALSDSLLGGTAIVEIDMAGRLIVVDTSQASGPVDNDGDDFAETIVIGLNDASVIVGGDATGLSAAIRAKLDTWRLMPLNDSELPTGSEAPAWSDQPTHTDEVKREPPASKLSTPADEETPPTQIVEEQEVARGVNVRVGSSVDRFESTALKLNLSNTALNQLNIGVVGDLGTGKTQLLKSLIAQIARAGAENRGIAPNFLIFDYKKDYASEDFVKAVGATVVEPYHLPLNLFDTTSLSGAHTPWLDRFQFFADVLDKIYSGIGPVQKSNLKKAVKAAYDDAAAAFAPRMPTLYDVQSKYAALLGGKPDAPLSIIEDLTDREVFVPSSVEAKPFAEFLKGVVVVSLAGLGQDDRGRNAVVALMLNMFYEHMLKIPKRPFIGTDPQMRAVDSYLLVDEADNIMQYEFDVLRKLLLQGREFGVGIILASQYLKHFKVNATDYREPLLTWFVHKVPNVSAAELAGLGLAAGQGELAERVKGLPNHHCLYKTFDVPGEFIRGLPFFELNR